MKVCIVSIAKCENNYIKEWVDHHLDLGFDHIYICDNNALGGEFISDVIVSGKRISILDYRGLSKDVQATAYTNCFLEYRTQYDWLLFLDIDEFVYLDTRYFKDIKSLLGDPRFSDSDIVRLYWRIFSNSKDLDVVENNYSVVSRFTEYYPVLEETYTKSFIRGNIEYTGGKVYGHGYFYNKNAKAVNVMGNKCQNFWSSGGFPVIHRVAWINHYPTKTIGEYIRQKYFRGGPNNNDKKYASLEYFFKYNIETEEKRKYGEALIERLSKENDENSINRS